MEKPGIPTSNWLTFQIGGCHTVEQYVGVFGEDVIDIPLLKACFGTCYWVG